MLDLLFVFVSDLDDEVVDRAAGITFDSRLSLATECSRPKPPYDHGKLSDPTELISSLDCACEEAVFFSRLSASKKS